MGSRQQEEKKLKNPVQNLKKMERKEVKTTINFHSRSQNVDC